MSDEPEDKAEAKKGGPGTGPIGEAAPADEKASLLAAARKRAQQLELVASITAQAGGIYDAPELMRQVVQMVAAHFDYPFVAILLLDAEGLELRSEAAAGVLARRVAGVYSQPVERGIMGRVAQSGEPYLARDVQADEHYVFELGGDDPIRSELAVPLRSGSRLAGVLDIESTQVNAFDASDVTAMQVLADQVSAALAKSEALAREKKRSAHLQMASEIAARVAGLLDVPELFRQVTESLVERFGFDNASIFLNDAPDRQAVLQIHAGRLLKSQAPGYRQSWDTGLVGLAIRTASTVLSNDVQSDPRYYSNEPGKDVCRAELCIPLKHGLQVHGLLDIQSAHINAFDAEDTVALETLADQVAVAIEKARLIATERKRAAQLTIVSRIASRTARLLPVREVLKEAVERIQEQFGYSSTVIFTNDPERREVVVAAAAGQLAHLPDDYRQPWSKGVLGHVALTGKTYLCRNSETDPVFIPVPSSFGMIQVRSELGVPLILDDQVIGIIDIHSEQPDAFDPVDVAAIETLADQLAGAVRNARLFQETRNRTLQLETLYEASRRVNSSLSVPDICAASAVALQETLGYGHVSIYLVEGRQLELQAERGYGAPLEAMDLERGIMARACRTRRPVYLPDVEADPEYIAAIPQVQSEIAVPLMRGEWVIGVLNVETIRPQALVEADLTLLSTFANHLAVAIDNGRLYDDARRRLEETRALYEFTTGLGETATIQALAQHALDSITRLIPFDIAEISLVDRSTGIVFPLVIGGPLASPQALDNQFKGALHQHDLRPGKGIVGWVAEHGEGIRIGDVTGDPRYLAWSPRIRSEMCMPLRFGGDIIGVVNLESERAEAFNEHAEELLRTLANPLAIALVNRRLYEQTREDAEVKAALLRELSHRVKNNLAAIASLLHLALGEAEEEREEILREATGRVESMVLAHELLARSQRARVDLVEFGRRIVAEAALQLAPPGTQIEVSAEGDKIEISPRQITPVALVLNELAANAIRHGVTGQGRGQGRLRLQARRAEYCIQLSVSDDGNALPADAGQSSEGIGLSLIQTLVEKDLKGMFSLSSSGGWTHATLQFQPED